MKNKITINFIRFINILTMVAAIIFAISIILFIHTMKDNNRRYFSSESNFIYRAEDNDFARMVRLRLQNKIVAPELEQKNSEIYAVADYFYASTKILIYKKMNSTLDVERYQRRKEEASTQMGVFVYEKEIIDNALSKLDNR